MLTQQKTLPVWTPKHWHTFIYNSNQALSVSFTKNVSLEVGENEK